MATDLVKAGHTVTGFNRSQEKIDKLVSEREAPYRRHSK
jgi:2-hydroxy-3-oxopropionate reductase